MDHTVVSPHHFPVLLRTALDLFRRPSPSGREELVRAYVVEHLETFGFTVTIDAAGNVLAERGAPDPRYPLLSFHMDCVTWGQGQSSVTPSDSPDALDRAFQRRSKRRARAQLTLRSLEDLAIERDWLHSRGKFVLGGDDKCGGAIALTLAATTTIPLKIVASVEEEVGGFGIAQVDPQFFEDVAYALVLDRRGANHLVVAIAGQQLCQGWFAATLMRAAAETGLVVYAVEGAYSDAVTLSQYLSNVVNLSVGYYHPHSVKEHVSLSDLWNAYRWVHEALKRLPCELFSPQPLHPWWRACEHLLCQRCQKFAIQPETLPEDLWGFLCQCGE